MERTESGASQASNRVCRVFWVTWNSLDGAFEAGAVLDFHSRPLRPKRHKTPGSPEAEK